MRILASSAVSWAVAIVGIVNEELATAVDDLIIIGTGVSGISAAYRFQEEFPHLNYTILDRRSEIGGTWDTFRYPGVRSDSDFFTYAFPWRPWPYNKTIVDGDTIRQYIVDAAEETGIDKHILFRHDVVRASWSSKQQLWTLSCAVDNTTETTFLARFVYWAPGIFSHKQPLISPIPGIENFTGTVVHPQFWPKDLEYAGKKVVIIGSGATAITLLPALSQKAKKVTMLQRTPSYILSFPAVDSFAVRFRPLLSTWIFDIIIRLKFIILVPALIIWSRVFPNRARAVLKKRTIEQLPPNFPFEPHFAPPYKVWDQRVCLTPDGDFYEAIRDGKADIATGVIDTCTPTGLRLASGEIVEDIDIIATATGLQLEFGGGAEIRVDGTNVVPGERILWRGMMLQDVPNAGFSTATGYGPVGFTLMADTSARIFMRVLRDTLKGRYSSVVPRTGTKYAGMKVSTLFGPLQSTFVLKTGHHIPKVGDRGPWKTRLHYLHDLWKLAFTAIPDGLVFTKA